MRHLSSRFVSTAALLPLLLALLPPAQGQDQTATNKGNKTDKVEANLPDSELMIFFTKLASCTEDIGAETVPLAEAAAVEAFTPTIGVVYKDLWKPNVWVELQIMVDCRDAVERLGNKAIIIGRRFRFRKDGRFNVRPVDPAQRFHIIQGVKDELTGEWKAPTLEQVRREVAAYIKATDEPPPGTVAWEKAEAARREMLVRANGASSAKPSVNVTSNK